LPQNHEWVGGNHWLGNNASPMPIRKIIPSLHSYSRLQCRGIHAYITPANGGGMEGNGNETDCDFPRWTGRGKG
jgi:hypothetical protein